jgi:hypothetical protein
LVRCRPWSSSLQIRYDSQSAGPQRITNPTGPITSKTRIGTSVSSPVICRRPCRAASNHGGHNNQTSANLGQHVDVIGRLCAVVKLARRDCQKLVALILGEERFRRDMLLRRSAPRAALVVAGHFSSLGLCRVSVVLHNNSSRSSLIGEPSNLGLSVRETCIYNFVDDYPGPVRRPHAQSDRYGYRGNWRAKSKQLILGSSSRCRTSSSCRAFGLFFCKARTGLSALGVAEYFTTSANDDQAMSILSRFFDIERWAAEGVAATTARRR